MKILFALRALQQLQTVVKMPSLIPLLSVFNYFELNFFHDFWKS